MESSPIVPMTQEEKKAIYEMLVKNDEEAGFTGRTDFTAEELKQRMIKNGIRPEDRIFQRELMAMRYGEEPEVK